MTTSAGIRRTQRPLLDSGYSCSVTDIVGDKNGPRLCVMAGMHVNEVSSIEAARRLEHAFDPRTLAGSVSVITVLNTPAWTQRSIGACPIDLKNINFCFPGSHAGTFSEQLAADLLEEWAADAACLVDLHGGDLGEDLMRYSICQLTGEPAFDARAQEIARCFDVDVIIALEPRYLASPGRSVSGLARSGRLGAFAEAGQGGVIAESDVLMHEQGVVRLAHLLGMIAEEDLPGAPPVGRAPEVLNGYSWIPVPMTGWSTMHVRAGDGVAHGDLIATVESLDGAESVQIHAPESGVVLWCDTHPAVSDGANVAGIGFRL